MEKLYRGEFKPECSSAQSMGSLPSSLLVYSGTLSPCPFQTKLHLVPGKESSLSLFLMPSFPGLTVRKARIPWWQGIQNGKFLMSTTPMEGFLRFPYPMPPPGRNSTDVSYPLNNSGCHCDSSLEEQSPGKRAMLLRSTGSILKMLQRHLPAGPKTPEPV